MREIRGLKLLTMDRRNKFLKLKITSHALVSLVENLIRLCEGILHGPRLSQPQRLPVWESMKRGPVGGATFLLILIGMTAIC